MLSRALVGVTVVVGVASGVSAQTSRTCVVQGLEKTPAAIGARVTVAGVVTAVFRTSAAAGFFLQDPSCDGDSTTSDAVWVDARAAGTTPAVGDRATVTGRVAEDGGLTSIVLESVSDEGRYAGSVEAVRLNPPADPAAASVYYESHEAMLVSLGTSRVVAATDANGVAYVVPDATGVTRLYRTDADGRKLGIALPEGWLALNQGDRLLEASGALVETPTGFVVWARGSRPPTVEAGRAAAAPASPAAAGVLGIATYHLGGLGTASDAASAARYPAELALRAQSIVRSLAAPDVVAVQGVGTLEALQDLAAQPELVAAGYRVAPPRTDDAGPLGVGLLYRADRVALEAAESRPAAGVAGTAPLVVRLQTAGRERLTLLACDFETTSSGPEAAAVRMALADHVRALADEARLADPGAGLVVLGHLADTEDSPPLARLQAGLLADPNARTSERPYTSQSLGVSLATDYVLVDAALAARVAEVRAVHVNVDWAHAAPGAAPGATARVSDHDPVLLRVRLP